MSFNSLHWVKSTRKPHRCDWCNRRIETGSAALYSAGKWEGDFSAGHRHPECAAACDSLTWKELEEGWYIGDFTRGRADDKDLPPEFSPDYRGK